MMPALEWPSLLYVGEVVVPFELGDASDPVRAQRQEWEESEGSDDDCADAGRVERSNRIWLCRRRNEMKLIKSGVRRSRHDARQILGIREEEEDARNGERNPAFEFESVSQWALPRRGTVSSYETCMGNRPRPSFSTAISATGAECKENRSEQMANESGV